MYGQPLNAVIINLHINRFSLDLGQSYVWILPCVMSTRSQCKTVAILIRGYCSKYSPSSFTLFNNTSFLGSYLGDDRQSGVQIFRNRYGGYTVQEMDSLISNNVSQSDYDTPLRFRIVLQNVVLQLNSLQIATNFFRWTLLHRSLYFIDIMGHKHLDQNSMIVGCKNCKFKKPVRIDISSILDNLHTLWWGASDGI